MYSLHQEQENLRAELRAFVDSEIVPAAAQLDHTGGLPRELF